MLTTSRIPREEADSFGPAWQVSRLCLLATVVSPLVVGPATLFPFTAVKGLFFRTAVEAAVIGTLVTLLRPSSRHSMVSRLARVSRQPLCVAVAVYVATMGLTALVGLDPWFSFWSNFERGEGVFQHLHYLAYLVLLAALLDTWPRWRTFLQLRTAVATAVCLVTLARVDVISAPPVVGRLSGPLGHPTYLAGYLVLEMCFTALLLIDAGPRGRIMYLVLLMAESATLLSTQTRAAVLAITVSGVVFGVGLLWIHTTGHRRQRWVLAGAGAVAVLAVTVWVTRAQPFWQASPSLHRILQAEGLDTVTTRAWAWQGAFEAVAHRPAVGFGVESGAKVFDRYQDVRLAVADPWFDHPHNVALDQLLSGGVLLFAAWVAIIVAAYWSLCRRRPRTTSQLLLIVAPMAYLLPSLAFFDVLVVYTGWLTLLALILYVDGGTVSHPRMRGDDRFAERERPWPRWAGAVALVGIAAVATAAVNGTWLPARKLLLVSDARRDLALDTTERLTAAFGVAFDSPSPIGDEETFKALLVDYRALFGASRHHGISIPSAAVQDMMDMAHTRFEELKTRFNGAQSIFMYANVCADAAQLTGDRRYLERALTVGREGLQRAPARLVQLGLLEVIAGRLGDHTAQAEWSRRRALLVH